MTIMSFACFLHIFAVISANIPPPYFFKFGTGAGDEKIDIKSMSGEVDVINRTLSPSFLLHGHNYNMLHVSIVLLMVWSINLYSIPLAVHAFQQYDLPYWAWTKCWLKKWTKNRICEVLNYTFIQTFLEKNQKYLFWNFWDA